MLRHGYQYVELSMRNGILENLDDHALGNKPGVVRQAGSTRQATKGGRVPYTAEEDRKLTAYVLDCEYKGASILGNKIYQNFELEVRTSQYRKERQLRESDQDLNRTPDTLGSHGVIVG